MPERIYLEAHGQREVVHQVVDHDHQLGIAGRVGPPENLDAELIELAIASLLRAFVAQHRAGIEIALIRGAAVDPGLDIGAPDSWRSPGPENHFVASPAPLHPL